MLRYRRYRVFLIFAVIALFALYQFTFGPRDWDTGKYSTEYLRQQFGLSNNAKEAGQTDQKPLELDVPAREKEEGTLTPPAVGSTEKPVQQLPPDRPLKGDSVQKGEDESLDGARVVPGGTQPFLDIPYEAGQGRLEAEPLPSWDTIHWTKPHAEHFPVESTIQLPSGTPKALPKVQFDFKKTALGKRDDKKLAIIKESFTHSWEGYKKKAWGKDEIRPVSGEARSSFNSWGATLVDSLDTLWIMGMKDEFDRAVKRVGEIDFTTSPRSDIPVFETTIRYLGGLIAAYDMSEHKYPMLLEKAKQLGEVLMGAFDTPNRMPMNFYQWKPTYASQAHRASNHVVMAELGSLSVEFTRLAQLTKDSKYYDAIARVTNAFEKWQKHTRVPGLWPLFLDASGCEIQQYSTGTQQVNGGSSVTVIDKNGNELGKGAPEIKDTQEVDGEGPKMVPLEHPKPSTFDATGAGSGQKKDSASGMGMSSQVMNSMINDEDKKEEPIPEGFEAVKKPEPFAFETPPNVNSDAEKPTPGGSNSVAKDSGAKKPTPGGSDGLGNVNKGTKPTAVTPGSIADSPGGMGHSSQVMNSMWKEEDEPQDESIPEGFVPLKKPEPVTFTPGVPGKAGRIQHVDVKTHDKEHPSAAQQEAKQKGPKAGPVGKIQYLEVGKDGKEHPREAPADKSGAVGKIQYVDVGKDGKEHPREAPAAKAGQVGKIQYVDVGKDGKEHPREAPVAKAGKDAKPPLDDLDGNDEIPENKDSSDLAYEKANEKAKKQMSKRTPPVIPGIDTIPKPKDTTNPAGTHVLQEEPVCLPHGLMSMSKYGREEFSFGSMADSTYEYLVKEYIMLGGLSDQYKTMYEAAIDAGTKHLLFRPMLPDNKDILLSGQYHVNVYHEDSEKQTAYSLHHNNMHLTCFVGGMYGMGAKIFGREADLDIAKKLTEGCVYAYESMPTGIMPETYSVIGCADRHDCKWNETAYHEALDPNPEVRQQIYESQVQRWKLQQEDEKALLTGKPDAPPKIEKPPSVKQAEEKKEEKSESGSHSNSPEMEAIVKSQQKNQDKEPKEEKKESDSGAHSKRKRQLDDAAPPKVEDEWVRTTPVSSAEDSRPTSYEPKKPATHEEFVANKIRDERLPAGFTAINDHRYLLRPEAIESVWYMHRITGDPHWREAGWRMFQAIERYTRAEFGHSAIDDVTKETPSHRDEMESFWLAETLKYFYLLFEAEDVVSLDEWVLNTEAHPFRRPEAEKKAGG